jgi:hypothetical protein
MKYFVLAFALLLPALASAQQGYVKAKINPGRAGVFVDGKYMGPAANFRVARKYAVSPGEHELKLVEPRFEEFSTKINVTANKTVIVSQALKALPPAKPPFGRLRTLSADKFSPVFVNGRFMGHAGEFNNSTQGLLLNPGEYTVRVADHEEKVKIDADKITIVNAKKA